MYCTICLPFTLKKIILFTIDTDIEDYNVEVDAFNHVKKIIHLARDIDQLTLSIKKENSKTSWYEKAIKDLDIVVDDDELYPFIFTFIVF